MWRAAVVPARFASTLSRSSQGVSGSIKSFTERQSSLLSSGLRTGSCSSSTSVLCRGIPAISSARTTSLSRQNPSISEQKRGLWDWALRPYAFHAAANAGTGLSTLSAGFSNVSLSLLVCPWKMLPTALVILPMAWAAPALYRMLFTNCSRSATSSFFNHLVQFLHTCMPTPSFENLFAELTFYITAICLTYFLYNLFPELMLDDGIWIFYCALFVMPILPLAFSYMPLFATRTYLIL